MRYIYAEIIKHTRQPHKYLSICSIINKYLSYHENIYLSLAYDTKLKYGDVQLRLTTSIKINIIIYQLEK